MANNVEFRDYSISVKDEINDILIAALHEAAGAVVSQTAKNTRVDTGQLKGSWAYAVDEAEVEAAIGSPLENAIWEEFGTGLYALNGDGRKSAWKYQDAKGKWHTTTGKKGTRAFFKAINKLRNPIAKMFEERLKGMK